MDSYWGQPKEIMDAMKAIEEATHFRERREKAVFMSDREVFEIFRLNNKYFPEYGVVTTFEGIPPDAVLERVIPAELERGFWFILTHPSFEPVPDGAPTPLVVCQREHKPARLQHDLPTIQGD